VNLIYPSLIGFLLLLSLALPAETEKIDLEKALVAPNFEYPFGTDYLGRDVFSRVLKALSIDIGLSLLIVSTSAIIGILLGLISGYYKIFDSYCRCFSGIPRNSFCFGHSQLSWSGNAYNCHSIDRIWMDEVYEIG